MSCSGDILDPPFSYPNGETASSLTELILLCEKMPVDSTRFLMRQDFENWLQHIGEDELSNKATKVRHMQVDDAGRLQQFIADCRFAILTSQKRQLIETLRSLKVSRNLPACLTLEEFVSEADKNIAQIENFWDFISEYQGQSVIALLGMVNAGKSSIGNILLERDGETFPVAPIRETAQACEIQWNDDTLLIDLPGLGSVLADEDDQVVQSIVRRANVLLIVIDASSHITRHCYDFLSKEVIRSGCQQRIVVVLNKVDAWGEMPEAHFRREVEKYTENLLHGDSRVGYKGIAELFDYAIPVIPFSVKWYSLQSRSDALAPLLSAIATAKNESANSALLRASTELFIYADMLMPLLEVYNKVVHTLTKRDETLSQAVEELVEEIDAFRSRELTATFENIAQARTACLESMQRSEKTSFLQQIAGDSSPEFQRKRNQLRSLRERYTSQGRYSFNQLGINLHSGLETLIRGHIGYCRTIPSNDNESVGKALDQVFYILWDAFDDMHILGKNVSEEAVQLKLTTAWEAVVERAGTWYDQFNEVLNSTIEASIQDSLNDLEPQRQLGIHIEPAVEWVAALQQALHK